MFAKRTTLTALVLLTTLAPAGVAQGPTFVYDGMLTPAAASAYGLEFANQFSVYLEAGDVISGSLVWYDGASDLDLQLIPPGGSCPLTPTPDTNCLVNSVPGRVICNGIPRGAMPGDFGPESFTWTVLSSGLYTIAVAGGFVGPLTSVPYRLTVDIDGVGDTESIVRGSDITYVGLSQCRVLDNLP